MKTLRQYFSLAALALALPFLGPPRAGAQQYGYTTLGSFTGSGAIINANSTTNIASITNASQATSFAVTKYDQFLLHLSWTPMNGASNVVTARWEFSSDGTNWPAQLTGHTNSSFCGWFHTIGADATNTSGTALFLTNITANSYGFYRITALTNTANVVLSNVAVRAYVKPRRNG